MVVSACVCVCVFSADESGDELAMKRFYDDKLHDAAQPSQRRSVSLFVHSQPAAFCHLNGFSLCNSVCQNYTSAWLRFGDKKAKCERVCIYEL